MFGSPTDVSAPETAAQSEPAQASLRAKIVEGQMNPSSQATGTSGRKGKKRPNLPKVRSGCVTCKRRRIKCDEQKPECNRCIVFGMPCEGYGVRISINRRKPDPKPLLPRTGDMSPASSSPQSSHSSQLSCLSSPSTRLPFRDESEERYFRVYQTKTTISVTWSRSRAFSSTLWDRIIMQAAHDESYLREMLVAIGSLTVSKDVQLKGYTDEAVQMQIFAVKRYGLALRSMSIGLSKLEDSEGPRKALIGCLLVCCFEWLLGNSSTALRHAGGGIRILRQWLRSYRGKKYKAGLCSPDSRVIEDELIQTFLRLDKQVATFGDPESNEERRAIIDESNETVRNMPSIFSSLQEARLYLELIERRGTHFGYIAAEYFAQKRTGSSTSLVDNAAEAAYMETLRYEIPQALIRWKLAFDIFYSGIPPSDTGQLHSAKTLLAQSTAMSIIMALSSGGAPKDGEELLSRYQSILSTCEEILEETKDQRQLGNFKFEQGIIMPLHIAARWCHDGTTRRKAIDLLRSYRSGDGEPMREGVWDSGTFADWDECTLENRYGSEWGDGSERFGDGHMRRAARDHNWTFGVSGGPVNWDRRSSSASHMSGGSSGSELQGQGQGQGIRRNCASANANASLRDTKGWVDELPVRASP
ncbi:hypothetical protein DSL72_005032 [Monilinia vaccinii-corymbosi]|uniref:Zn(2)-C6 fungal-type domain-containing protein n=1 Tax=Monilinia vaccinii-corymbosi TaxID=61207 RepID=A0A8A3PEH9_9HELO|nr:hypothetical protein DSL72_005032 [Monilinia vaccinii-corymbosi]